MNPNYQRNVEAEADAIPGRSIQGSALVLGYETGAVQQRAIFAESSSDEAEVRAYYADLLAELSDVVTQAGIIFEKVRPLLSPALQELYADFPTLMHLGSERQIERMSEWKKRVLAVKA